VLVSHIYHLLSARLHIGFKCFCATVFTVCLLLLYCCTVCIASDAKYMYLGSRQRNVYTILKNRTPETFYYIFTKIAVISIKICTHNLHVT